MTVPRPADPPPLRWRAGPVELAYEVEGEGPLVLMIHGLPGARRDFRRLAAALRGACRVVRVDLPGFGDSPAVAGLDAIDPVAACLVDFLGSFGEPAIVVGHSFGGVFALAVADRAPELVRGLGLLASPGLRRHRAYRPRALAALARLLADPRAAALLAWPLRQMYRLGGLPTNTSHGSRVLGIRLVATLSFADQRARAARLRAPTLIAWADDDPLVEAAIVAEFAAVAPAGPRLRFARAGHNIPHRVAGELAAAMLRWSGELAQTPG